MTNKYCEYFNIDKDYYPCVDVAAIRAGVDWKKFYPHETFIKLLNNVEKALSRRETKSIWIEGAYGTGKSHATLALKKILEAPNSELEEYFNRYEKLPKDLLTKLKGHKNGKILTAHRYASSDIHNDRDLIFAVQESIKESLLEANLAYKGENTLKEGVIAWLSDAINKDFFNSLLQQDKYKILFNETDVDGILEKLNNSTEIGKLMDKIFQLADERGITALNINMQQLIKWIEDIIDNNDLKAIVLIWDEFSDYFKNNSRSLTEFQNLVSLCQHKPFYLMIVTHEAGSLFHEKNTDGRKILDRFMRSEITMPRNIAFDLIVAALVKKDTARKEWDAKSDDLNSRMNESRQAVEKVTEIKQEVLKGVLPLHPMAALLLKDISSAFKSNQRSMFDFIKTQDSDEAKSFKWFIENFGPLDDQPLLTIDMLWSFFYENGRDNLTLDIRSILDTYSRYEKQLNEKEKRVLKTVLMMQAINQRMGDSMELFRTTDKNLNNAFEGTDLETNVAVNIAKKLVRDEILYNKPFGNGQTQFAAATNASDQAQIDKIKERLRNDNKTASFVDEGELNSVLALTPALKLRYEITSVTADNFTRILNELKNKPDTWKLRAILAFAKNEAESVVLNKYISEAALEDSHNIVMIDTTSTTFGIDKFEQYIDYTANSEYQRGKDNAFADDMNKKAKNTLNEWKDEIYKGQFKIYSKFSQSGETASNIQAVHDILINQVIKKYPFCFDNAKTTETMFGLSNFKQGTECGIKQETKGAFNKVESVIQKAWQNEKYWENQPALPISKIKTGIDEQIELSFKENGRISIKDIIEKLIDEYGFMPCNLSAFLTGFLLKEYVVDKFRYSDGDVSEAMNTEKLKEMVDECLKLYNTPNSRYNDKFIVIMSENEREFCNLIEKVFKIPQNKCESVEAIIRLLRSKMKELGYPIWGLKEIDNSFDDFIDKFIQLVNPDESNKNPQKTAAEIGKMSKLKPSVANNLSSLITKDKCAEGMNKFLKYFENGELLELAQNIKADNNQVLNDIKKQFDGDGSAYLWVWDKSKAEGEIRKLIADYSLIDESNKIYRQKTNSLKKCLEQWRDTLKFLKISNESLKDEFKDLHGLLDILKEIAKDNDLTTENKQILLKELNAKADNLKDIFDNPLLSFRKTCNFYLDGLTEKEVEEVYNKLNLNMFVMEKHQYSKSVDESVKVFKKSQAKTKLKQLWKEKTNTKTPRDWSDINKTPILCLVPDNEFGDAKKVFDIINRDNPDDSEIDFATKFIENTGFLSDLNNKSKQDNAFQMKVLENLSPMFSDLNDVKDYLSKKLAIEPYDWYLDPAVKTKLKEFAQAKYNAGGSDKVLKYIEKMDDKKLKEYMKHLIKENMIIGLELITNSGD